MVSVIIPVFNAEKTLPDCVRSVLRQTYSDYELILIDDGSKDRTWELISGLHASAAFPGPETVGWIMQTVSILFA